MELRPKSEEDRKYFYSRVYYHMKKEQLAAQL